MEYQLVLTLKGKNTERVLKSFESNRCYNYTNVTIDTISDAKGIVERGSITRALLIPKEQGMDNPYQYGLSYILARGFKISRVVLILDDIFYDVTGRKMTPIASFDIKTIPYILNYKAKEIKDEKEEEDGEGEGLKKGQTLSKSGSRAGNGQKATAAKRDKARPDKQAEKNKGCVLSPKVFSVKAAKAVMPLTIAALATFIGGASMKVLTERKSVNIPELVLALEMGTDPRPALECNTAQPKAVLLVVLDISDSCQGFQPQMKGITQALANAHSDIEVRYVQWSNGSPENEPQHLIGVDMVVYFGDSDIFHYIEDGSYGNVPMMLISNESHTKRGIRLEKGTLPNVAYVTGVTPGFDTENAQAVILGSKYLFNI